MKTWQEFLFGVFIGILFVWVAIEIYDLKQDVRELKLSQANTAFYLVETSSGKHLKLGQIK